MIRKQRLATAREICQWIYADPAGVPIRPSTLRVWVARKRLATHGHRGRWNLYDVDEVLRLVRLRDTRVNAARTDA